MTDSVAVFPPSYRLTDNTTGAVLAGGYVEFYDASTTTPKTVYSDPDLLISLGTSVTADSLGCLTSDGSTKTMVYVGTSPYKAVIKTSAGVTIATYDNLKGAVATVDPGDTSVVATRPVSTKSLSYTIVSGDQSTVFVGNCSGGDVSFTLPSAVTVGAGWFVTVQHAGSANQVMVATVSSQTISSGATSYSTVMALAFSGEEVTLVSDGGNWRVVSHTGPHIKRAQGILTVADRLTAPPGSEVQGSLYMISGAPSGAWSSFAQHDIVQYTNSAWVKFTPVSGAVAYVQDEAKYYRFISSAWVSETASETVAGTAELATQSEVEAATDTSRIVVPARLQNHPGVAKAWIKLDLSAGSANILSSYNIASAAYTSTGKFTVTFSTAFSSANYIAVGTARDSTATANFTGVTQDTAMTQNATTMGLKVVQAAVGFLNSSDVQVAFFGDQ